MPIPYLLDDRQLTLILLSTAKPTHYPPLARDVGASFQDDGGRSLWLREP